MIIDCIYWGIDFGALDFQRNGPDRQPRCLPVVRILVLYI